MRKRAGHEVDPRGYYLPLSLSIMVITLSLIPYVDSIIPANTPQFNTDEKEMVLEIVGDRGDSMVYIFPEDYMPARFEGLLEGFDNINSGMSLYTHNGRVDAGLMDGKKRLLFGIPIDVNLAGADDLTALPGIGPALAEEIVRKREEIGGFKAVEDLIMVRGIGRVRFNRIKQYITLRKGN